VEENAIMGAPEVQVRSCGMKKALSLLLICLVLLCCTSCGRSLRGFLEMLSARPKETPVPRPTRTEVKPTYQDVKKAIFAADGDRVKMLLEKNPDLISEKDADGNTLLHHAARRPDISVVRALIFCKADINAQNKWDFTPLHELARREETNETKDIVIELCACKVDVNARTWYGNTPLDIAEIKGNREISSILINNGARRNKHVLNLPPLPPDEQQN
jgi:hypothetical protein